MTHGHHDSSKRGLFIPLGAAALSVLCVLRPAIAQTPQEHEQHHPATPPPAMTAAPGQPAMPSPPPTLPPRAAA